MTERQVDHLTFTEAHTADEVFVRVSAINEFVGILLTARHHGHIDVYFYANECNQILEALEVAAREARSNTDETREAVASIRSGRAGTTLEFVAKVGVERGLVVLDLAIEGDEDLGDRVWVYLTDDQNKWLIEALRKAME